MYKIPKTFYDKLKEGIDYRDVKGNVVKNTILTYDSIRPFSYAYCSDTSFFPKIVDQIKNIDILYVATFERRKNLLTLIKGFKILKDELKVDYKLVLAGSTYINGDNKVLLEIKKYIKENNLFNSILMPGYIDKKKALYFYNNSLMYVFPSIDEGFGTGDADFCDRAEERMKQFERDVLHWINYDYVVINEDLKKCFQRIKNLIDAEINNGSKDYDLEFIREHINRLTF